MRSTAPFAVSAAPAEAGNDMNAVATYTVKTYTEGFDPFDATILQCMKECTNADCIECNGR